MTTLRREIRKTIFNVLVDYNHQLCESAELLAEIADKIADSLNSNNPNFFNDKPKIDLSKTDPAWAILAGEPVDTTDSILVYDAKNAFERDMKFGTLPWSSTKAWERMEKHVVEEYTKDNLIFTKYKTWQQNEGKFVAMSNRKIKERPEDFIACWPDFLAHSAMYSPKSEGKGWEVDDHGAPISY